ncbi:hypothetical protein [Pseudomonas sp. RC10]|uniref:hypothetical protein n=1 Tax=Pseudomonas bambusae TaxID=3139142 RepID=UPI003138FA58
MVDSLSIQPAFNAAEEPPVEIFDDGKSLGLVRVNNGAWSFTVPPSLSVGVHTLTAKTGSVISGAWQVMVREWERNEETWTEEFFSLQEGTHRMSASGLVVDWSEPIASPMIHSRFTNAYGYILIIKGFRKVEFKFERTVSHINMRILDVLIDPPAKFVVKAYEGSTVVHSKQFEGEGDEGIQEFAYPGQVTSLSLVVEDNTSTYEVLVGGITWMQ